MLPAEYPMTFWGHKIFTCLTCPKTILPDSSGTLRWADWWRTVSAKVNLKEEIVFSNVQIPTQGGVLLWCSEFRIWCCHCSGLGCCCGSGSILAQEFPHAMGTAIGALVFWKTNVQKQYNYQFLSETYQDVFIFCICSWLFLIIIF